MRGSITNLLAKNFALFNGNRYFSFGISPLYCLILRIVTSLFRNCQKINTQQYERTDRFSNKST